MWTWLFVNAWTVPTVSKGHEKLGICIKANGTAKIIHYPGGWGKGIKFMIYEWLTCNVGPFYFSVLEPISSSIQLRMHTKPERDEFTIPKILLNVVFEEIAIVLQRQQYLDVMELLESFERMALSSKYRKYRPLVQTKKGHAKDW